MIPFEEMDARLANLGENRAWLSRVSGRKPDSIRVALAKSAPASKRSPLIQKALSDAIEREESARSSLIPTTTTEPILPDRITIEVEPSRMDNYLEASARASLGLKAWVIAMLDKAAASWVASKPPSPNPSPPRRKISANARQSR